MGSAISYISLIRCLYLSVTSLVRHTDPNCLNLKVNYIIFCNPDMSFHYIKYNDLKCLELWQNYIFVIILRMYYNI